MERPRSSRVNDRRGNNRDRAARKHWMLRTWDVDLPPWNCRCVHCGCVLSYDTVQADRINPGGSYRRENVQPACNSCNRSRSNKQDWIHPNRQHASRVASEQLPAAA